MSVNEAIPEAGVMAVITMPDDKVVPAEDMAHNAELVATKIATMLGDGTYKAAADSPRVNKAHNAVVGMAIEVGPAKGLYISDLKYYD
jgi:hypothetical protein